MASIPLDEMVTRGACTSDIDILRPLYTDEILILHPDEITTIVNSGVNALWALKMLDIPHQIALAEAWYDRAMSASLVAWKADVKALLGTPDGDSAKMHDKSRGLESRAAATETEKCEAGVGHAMAAIGVLLAAGHGVGSKALCKAMLHFAGWCDRCIVDVEAITLAASRESLVVDMLTSFDLNGIVEIL
jgi:hypothetical protein